MIIFKTIKFEMCIYEDIRVVTFNSYNIFNALYPSYFLNEFETYILIHKVNFVLI